MSQNLRGKQNFRNVGQRGQTTARDGQNKPGQIRLRRTANKQSVIRQNLSHMEQQAHKKRLAQEFYYRNKAGQSPLMRMNTVDVQGTNNKPSVHKRLGETVRLKRTNNVVQNKVPLRVNKGPIRLQRKYTAQNRLKAIRQDAALTQRSIVQRNVPFKNNIQRGTVQRAFIQRGSNQQAVVGSQKIRLHRNRPQSVGGAINYTVQVANSSVKNNGFAKHRVSMTLNPTLQEEIRMIQHKNISQSIVPAEPIHPTGTGMTSKSLHERFSGL